MKKSVTIEDIKHLEKWLNEHSGLKGIPAINKARERCLAFILRKPQVIEHQTWQEIYDKASTLTMKRLDHSSQLVAGDRVIHLARGAGTFTEQCAAMHGFGGVNKHSVFLAFDEDPTEIVEVTIHICTKV